MSVTLDGFIAGPDGSIDWAAPDEELMAFHNEDPRVGRPPVRARAYDDMLPWETDPSRSESEFARLGRRFRKLCSRPR